MLANLVAPEGRVIGPLEAAGGQEVHPQTYLEINPQTVAGAAGTA
jgi:hypothetical protein